ncbi:ABC transporter permease [Marinactinospora thermotolerans]|uniref:Transport permease protein n=1 Tax=Marinactinospora thermotolerans DSM 45154 TaxID=1122192 RepID=A0A1T4PAZ8_9ACTN|nr:ABC transporter permease [Marinactinospora thermotolerans]SJZ88720.1 ABC-2 type transport system permease protein [Marinactinospora thermotolerans DSM 45154]
MNTTLIGDTLIVFGRELRPVLRDPFSVVFSLAQPLFFLALFAPLIPAAGGTAETLQWFVPGLIVMSCLFATSSTGSNLQFEMQTGAHERMLVSPLRRPALIIGRALKEIVPTFAQAALLIAVTIPFGFRPDPVGAILGLLLLCVFCVGLGALSYTLALASRNQEWVFWGVQQTLLFPLLLLAGMLLPVDNGPEWLRVLSRFNPLTHVVEAERALFDGRLLAPEVAAGVVAAVAVAAVGLFIGTRAMRRATG